MNKQEYAIARLVLKHQELELVRSFDRHGHDDSYKVYNQVFNAI